MRRLTVVLYSTRLGSSGWKLGEFSLVASRAPLEHPLSFVLDTEKRLQWSPGYTAPEVLTSMGDPDTPTKYNRLVDIWALGCILYKLMYRKNAFPGNYDVYKYISAPNCDMLQLHAFLDPTVMSPELEGARKVIPKMLDVTAEKRPSAKVLIHAFQTMLDGHIPSSPPIARW